MSRLLMKQCYFVLNNGKILITNKLYSTLMYINAITVHSYNIVKTFQSSHIFTNSIFQSIVFARI